MEKHPANPKTKQMQRRIRRKKTITTTAKQTWRRSGERETANEKYVIAKDVANEISYTCLVVGALVICNTKRNCGILLSVSQHFSITVCIVLPHQESVEKIQEKSWLTLANRNTFAHPTHRAHELHTTTTTTMRRIALKLKYWMNLALFRLLNIWIRVQPTWCTRIVARERERE